MSIELEGFLLVAQFSPVDSLRIAYVASDGDTQRLFVKELCAPEEVQAPDEEMQDIDYDNKGKPHTVVLAQIDVGGRELHVRKMMWPSEDEIILMKRNAVEYYEVDINSWKIELKSTIKLSEHDIGSDGAFTALLLGERLILGTEEGELLEFRGKKLVRRACVAEGACIADIKHIDQLFVMATGEG